MARRIAMRDGWHSIASIDAPAIVAASGCAPPMPPRPAVRIHLSASCPPKCWRPASANVSYVPCTMPWLPM